MNFRPALAAAAALLALACAGRSAAPTPAAAVAPPRDWAAEAYAARKANDFAKAEAVATSGIDAGQGSAKLYFERGVARMALQNKDGALADLKQVNAIQEDPAALLLMGSIQLQLSKWAEAEKDLARATELDPKNARAWASLSQARIALRDVAGATAAYDKAVTLAPADTFVKEVGDRLARITPKPADPNAPAAPGAPPASAPALQPAAAPAPAPAPALQPAAAPAPAPAPTAAPAPAK